MAMQLEFTDTAPAHFQADFDQRSKELVPWVRHGCDGWYYISLKAPTMLVRQYNKLRTAGFANGWLA